MQLKKMTKIKLPKPTISLNSRKYRFLLSEVILFGAFWTFYNWIMALFPLMDAAPADEILAANDYTVYMVLMLICLFFLALAVFLLGVWWQQWRNEKGDNVCAIP